ncbi:ABC transporter permease [Streptomyces venezuelae]|uniref:ABC transporter permease n=1 Tax=Streptomyces venezuelae TaxID=54571 RepID=UPI00332C685B
MSAALPATPVLHSEWIKIRSLRGSFWSLISVLVLTAGIQALAAAALEPAEEGGLGDDPLLGGFYGLNFGQIAAIAFGVTAFSTEFHNGALRTSLTAVPDRTRFYFSKIAMLGVLMLAAGHLTGLLTFLAGQSFRGHDALELGDPGTVRAVVGCGLYLTLMTLFAAGLTAVLRSGVAVLSILIPFVVMVSFVVGAAATGVGQFMPDRAGQAMMRSQQYGDLGPWAGLGVLALWALAAVLAGWLAVRRRDA